MGSFTGDMLRILASGGMKLGTELLGNALTIPMQAKATGKINTINTILRSLSTLPEEAMPGAAEVLERHTGVKLPTYSAPTGSVIGPEGERLLMTPKPGTPVTPEVAQRFLRPTPDKEALIGLALQGLPSETMRQAAIGNIAPKLVPSFEDIQRYGPEGLEKQKLALAGEELKQNQQKINLAKEESGWKKDIAWAGIATDKARNAISQGQLDAHLRQIDNDFLKYVNARDHNAAILKLEEKKVSLDEASKQALDNISRAKLADDYLKAGKDLDAVMLDRKNRQMDTRTGQQYLRLRNTFFNAAESLLQGTTAKLGPKKIDPRIEALKTKAIGGDADAQNYLDQQGIGYK